MHRWVVVVGVSTATMGCGDAFRAHPDVVATAAGHHELSVHRLAEIFALAPELLLNRVMVDRMARNWVEYILLAERTAAGDSLVDPATVREMRWPDERRWAIDVFHDRLLEEYLVFGDAAVDSAYRSGEVRYLAHVLLRVDEAMSLEERSAKRRQAEELRARLDAGGTWDEANELSEDTNAKSANGSLGVIRRGETVPRFENAAFGLAPGEISGVTETDFGYHIILRPALDDVRERFAGAVENLLVERFDSLYAEKLVVDKRVEFRPGAAGTIRDVARETVYYHQSPKVIATFEGGRYTAGDFVRWLQLLPFGAHDEIINASDEQIVEYTESFVVQELLWRQADSAGIQITDSLFDEMKRRARRQITNLTHRMNVTPESLAVAAPTVETRDRVVELRVDEFLLATAKLDQPRIEVPPFLADLLRRELPWTISQAGVQRALERAQEMRAAVNGGAGRNGDGR